MKKKYKEKSKIEERSIKQMTITRQKMKIKRENTEKGQGF